MSVYANWQADLLSAVRLPDTAHNRRFLTAWHEHAESNCDLNPIDLTHVIKDSGSGAKRHSHDCKATGFVGRSYQRYDDRVWTRTAFYAQITSAKYQLLLAALKSGNPYAVQDRGAVASDIGEWGSQTFANFYLNPSVTPQPTGPVSAPLKAHHAWHGMLHSVFVAAPKELIRSAEARKAMRHLKSRRGLR